MCIEEIIENLEGELCYLNYGEGDNQTIKQLNKLISDCRRAMSRLKSTKSSTRLSAEYVDDCKARLNNIINSAKNRIGELTCIEANIIGFIR